MKCQLLGSQNDMATIRLLSVEVIGNRMKCFINGYLAFDQTDDSFAKGSFGVRGNVNELIVDNLAVEEIDTFSLGANEGTSSEPDSSEDYTYPEGVYYQDDFAKADYQKKGWSVSTLGHQDEKMHLKGISGAYLTGLTELATLTDYTVEAELSFDTLGASDGVTKYGAIVGRSAGKDKGYEFGLFLDSQGNYKVRLYCRGGESLIQEALYPWDMGNAYTLKMVFYGKRIMCFVDDVLVIDKTATQQVAGTAGVYRSGYGVFYDNYVVRVSTDNEKQGIGKVYPTPEADKNGIYFADGFDAKSAIFGGVWGDETGLIEDGKLLVETGTSLFLNGNPGYANLTDYVMQAEFTLTDTEPRGVENWCVPALVARGSYEFGVMYASGGTNARLRLYDRGNLKELALNTDFTFKPGTTYTLTLMVEGDRIRGFVDGTVVFDVKDNAHKDGAMGIKAQNTTFSIDNFMLRKVTAADRSGDSTNIGIPDTGDSTVVYVTICVAAMLLAAAVLLLLKRKSVLHN